MAHNAIPLTTVTLVDNWPGVVNPNLSIPTNGWDNTFDNFGTTSGNITPSVPIGTKVMAYTDNTHQPGWYTMMYLMYHSFESDCISQDMSDSVQLCVPFDGSTAELYDNTNTPWFVVTNEVTNVALNNDGTRSGLIAFPCATLDSDGTSAYGNGYGDSYGWFWVGGVCPCKDATILDGTSGNGLGVEFACSSGFYGGALAIDISTSRIFLSEYNQASDLPFTGQTSPIVGYSCASGT